jgi:hypothetical protein
MEEEKRIILINILQSLEQKFEKNKRYSIDEMKALLKSIDNNINTSEMDRIIKLLNPNVN